MSDTPMHYEFIRAKLKDCDPVEISRKSGAVYDRQKQEFRVLLMGRNYFVSYPSGEICDFNHSEISNFPVKTLILRYLVHAQGAPPTEKDITYREVSGGQVYYRNFYGRCIMRLVRMFSKDFPALEYAMAKLNALKTTHGDLSYRFQFMNNIYVTFILWNGDEEFPTSANILFDANTPDYFNAEDHTVVCDIALSFLKELSK
ncbi:MULTISPECIES: DUF3786 domain-containing protein [unclassified Dehalobacter]|uniref:DUF3786 domain-containing protein n=1 Tax=unclassified Dehalobacter TaxID=2635733 RepID=UPI001FA99E11|nr:MULTISPECIES: DUF3786 domain-containing protein [unclassified Dehalobacter]